MSWMLAALAAWVVVAATPATALVIYRFGGEDLPAPPEAGQPGVQFRQVAWTALDSIAGGEQFDLDLSAAAVRALRRDPTVDIAPTIEQNGGIYLRPSVNKQVWDNDTSTVWEMDRYLCAEFSETNYFLSCTDDFGTPGTANIDLGGLYLIDRIRVISGLRDPATAVTGIRVFIALEMPFVTVTHHPPPFDGWVAEVRDNRLQVLDIPIPPHEEVGFLQVAARESDTDLEIHDIQIFARGYVKRSTFTSNIIDFGREMAWGEMRWSGTKGERAKVLLQSRSGTDPDPVRYFRYTGRGDEKAEVTGAEYRNLKPGEKAGSGHDQEHWAFWSAYDFGDSLGTQIVSVSPRRYFQFQVDFLPQEDDGGEVAFVELRASVPVATDLVGEVWPVEAPLGELTQFTYVLRPTIGAGDAGFDRVEIRSLSLLGSVSGVRVGDVPVDYRVESADEHRIVVAIPRLGSRDSGALVEVDFEAQVLRYGASFDGRVADSAQPLEVPQSVSEGDATGQYEGNRLSVATSEEKSLLQVSVDTQVVTPNDDGANDEAQLAYEILEITGQARVRVEIFDLAGRRVRSLHDGPLGIGRHLQSWNGRNDAGDLLPPGIYPYSVSVASDRKDVNQVGILYVAY